MKKTKASTNAPNPPGAPKETSDALVSRECVQNLLDNTCGSYKCFNGNKLFYKKVDINPHRWAQLYRGEKSITIDELKRLCAFLHVPFSTKVLARQMNMFD